ncbi:multidrug resistance protein [Vibrio nigripulchritudo]|uniref:MFS transporter n=1 Tax=Vibrio nigripulchritudo TaxID=28173 RepID=UPI00190C21A9|nr:MFS transporter [Vibrio nigripulchritudo]BCL69891.1 multidrug resistance protein [Vibrio nigripulchritudo]BDU31238.1 multidrug resistance protein [Vibrio nigripulchritudo]
MIDTHSSSYRSVSFALAFGSFIVFNNLYLFQPMLPLMADHFGVSSTQVNWILAAGTFALAFSLVPWAVLSEKIGRRKVMLISLFLLPFVGLTLLTSESLLTLTLSRAAMGFALAGYAAVAVGYMAEEFSPQALALAVGTYVSANSLGGIAGRLFGGLVTQYFDWQSAVIGMAIFSLLAAILVLKLLPPQKHFKPQPGLFFHHNRSVLKHLKNRELLLAMLLGGVNFALFVNLYSVAAFRLVEPPYELPVGIVSMIFLCYLAGTISSRLSGNWRKRFSSVSGMVLGSVISASGMLLAYVDSISALVAGLLLVGFGAFFVHSLAYGWVSQRARYAKATATALYLVHYYIGGSLGGFLLIYCWQHGGWGSVILGGSGLYIAMFLLCYKLKGFERLKSDSMMHLSKKVG